MMQPLAVDPRALRVLVGPDIKIVPGRAVMARVVAAGAGGRGSLSIAGFLLDAELPAGVRTGEDLRLVVRDVSAERVLLSIAEQHDKPPGEAQAASAQPAQTLPAHIQLGQPDTPPPIAVPLPGGGTLQVTERDAGRDRSAGGGGGSHGLTLRYDAPALGAVDLRFQLDESSVHVGITVDPGESLDLARAQAERLRQALAGSMATHTAGSVTVSPRRRPLDLYA
jgi:Flagellar hook-length control protein FliK